MSEVLEVTGIRDMNGKAITIVEGTTAVVIGSMSERALTASHCRKLALQLHRCARRLDALALSDGEARG